MADRPSGRELASGHLCDSISRPLPLSEPGVHQLAVAATTDVSGRYDLRFAQSRKQSFTLQMPDTVGSNNPADGAGEIAAPGGSDTYEFAGEQEQKYFIDNSGCEVITGSELLVSVSGPNGGTLLDEEALCAPDATYSWWMTPEESGKHRITVTGRGDATGTYGFDFYEIDDQDFTIQHGQTVEPGSPAAGAGQIEPAGQQDHFSFTGEAGDRVTLRIHDCTYTDPDLTHEYGFSFGIWNRDTESYLLEPARRCAPDEREVTAVLPAGGDYDVHVYGVNAGTYSFTFSKG